MVQADIYFLTILLRSYEGQNVRLHLSNRFEFVGFIGKLSANHSVVEMSDETDSRSYIPLCEIVAIESTNGLPFVLPHRSCHRYAKVQENLTSCTKALNNKAFQLWKQGGTVSIYAIGETAENVLINDVVPGLIQVGSEVFVTAKVIELRHVILE